MRRVELLSRRRPGNRRREVMAAGRSAEGCERVVAGQVPSNDESPADQGEAFRHY